MTVMLVVVIEEDIMSVEDMVGLSFKIWRVLVCRVRIHCLGTEGKGNPRGCVGFAWRITVELMYVYKCMCYRASTNSITVTSSSTATAVESVSTAVTSGTSNAANSTSGTAGRISPSPVDDSSTSSSCLASTPVSDKPVHFPKKVVAIGASLIRIIINCHLRTYHSWCLC